VGRKTNDAANPLPVPPPQHNLRHAADQAADAAGRQSPPQLEWLGARPAGSRWRLGVLEEVLEWEPSTGVVRTSAGGRVRPVWQVLTLHYLAVGARPPTAPPAVTFADLPAGRAYAPVYRGRVIERLCHTVGRDARTLRQAGAALGGRPVPGRAPPAGSAPDLAMDFQVFPRVGVRLVWYAGDEELAPSASLLLPGNIESFFCTEDIVVLSERLVSRLSGGGF